MSSVAAYQEFSKLSEEELINQYGFLVKKISFHMLSKLPQSVQVDDVLQAGMMGLLEAGRKFDPTKGASFETYAGIRIRGTILDDMRRQDWFPRSVYKNARMVTEAIRNVENRVHRDAKDGEVAEELGISLEEYNSLLQMTNSSQIFGFDDLGIDEDVVSSNDQMEHHDPFKLLCHEHFCETLAEAISTLPEREKLVLSLYYDEELNLKEIGQVLEVSESRVCQIHSAAMARLRSKVPEWKKRK